jgi:hypothetical protein
MLTSSTGSKVLGRIFAIGAEGSNHGLLAALSGSELEIL